MQYSKFCTFLMFLLISIKKSCVCMGQSPGIGVGSMICVGKKEGDEDNSWKHSIPNLKDLFFLNVNNLWKIWDLF